MRDPWDVSASNYAYTLKGTEDWMFVGKPEFDGMSFYDAVHTEKGPLVSHPAVSRPSVVLSVKVLRTVL